MHILICLNMKQLWLTLGSGLTECSYFGVFLPWGKSEVKAFQNLLTCRNPTFQLKLHSGSERDLFTTEKQHLTELLHL